jgi:hypothetical protein
MAEEPAPALVLVNAKTVLDQTLRSRGTGFIARNYVIPHRPSATSSGQIETQRVRCGLRFAQVQRFDK